MPCVFVKYLAILTGKGTSFIFQQCFAPKGLCKYNYFLILEQILKVYIMKEKSCNHIGFIVEYPDRYECTKCNDIAYKCILKGVQGVWADGKIPPEVSKQYAFEKYFQMQKDDEMRNKRD